MQTPWTDVQNGAAGLESGNDQLLSLSLHRHSNMITDTTRTYWINLRCNSITRNQTWRQEFKIPPLSPCLISKQIIWGKQSISYSKKLITIHWTQQILRRICGDCGTISFCIPQFYARVAHQNDRTSPSLDEVVTSISNTLPLNCCHPFFTSFCPCYWGILQSALYKCYPHKC